MLPNEAKVQTEGTKQSWTTKTDLIFTRNTYIQQLKRLKIASSRSILSAINTISYLSSSKIMKTTTSFQLRHSASFWVNRHHNPLKKTQPAKIAAVIHLLSLSNTRQLHGMTKTAMTTKVKNQRGQDLSSNHLKMMQTQSS